MSLTASFRSSYQCNRVVVDGKNLRHGNNHLRLKYGKRVAELLVEQFLRIANLTVRKFDSLGFCSLTNHGGSL